MRQKRLGEKLSSAIWRLLTRYGRVKYRYLLPLYRALGVTRPAITLRGARAITRMINPTARSVYLDQVSKVTERVRASKGAVIFLPSVGWEIVNTQRVHHLAREFARQGYVSVFDSSNAFDDVDGFKEIAPNLFLYRGPDSITARIPDAVLWAFTYNFDLRAAYPSSCRAVYDLIDDFGVFPYKRNFLESNHRRALEEAALVTSVARRLHEQVVAARPDALYLPNGVEYDHFAREVAAANDPDIDGAWRAGKPVAGYYGAMAEWFDYDLLERVARLRADWNFLLIGPMFDNSLRERGRALLKLPNVRWIGERPYQTLPGYARLFDVAMIPFRINDITEATSPLKLYEYFAAAKPVIAAPIRECRAFAEVRLVRSAEEFSTALDRARRDGEDEEFRARLRKLGRENSWAARVEQVAGALGHAAPANRP